MHTGRYIFIFKADRKCPVCGVKFKKVGVTIRHVKKHVIQCPDCSSWNRFASQCRKCEVSECLIT